MLKIYIDSYIFEGETLDYTNGIKLKHLDEFEVWYFDEILSSHETNFKRDLRYSSIRYDGIFHNCFLSELADEYAIFTYDFETNTKKINPYKK